MKKLYMAAGVAAVVVGLVAFAVVARNTDSVKPSTVASAKKPGRGAPACLTGDKALTIPAAGRSGIEMAAASQLTDVPAGTTTTVNIATYDGETATGSEIYPQQYGSYNFTAQKRPGAAANQQSWDITTFRTCKE